MLEGPDGPPGPLPRLLGLPRRELDRPLPGGGAHLGGDRPVRPASRPPASLHLLLGVALHLAQPRLARAGRGARPHPPRRHLRDGGEPPVAARHPRAVPSLRALQVGVEDRELPRPVHRLEHVAQPLHQAPARQPRQHRAGAPCLRAGAGAGKLDHDVPRGDALARRPAARFQAGRLHARAADRRAHPADRDRGHGERAAETRLRPAGTARDPRARARRDPARELRDGARREGDRRGPGAVRGRARAGQLTMDLRAVTVAVTGATGFLGRYIVDVLLARGAHVLGVVRNPGRVPELAARGVELRQADLAERDRLARGFGGAQAVVSNAALFSLRNRSWEDHHRANIQGTENVFGALADAGVKRVVHVSSVAVSRAHGPRVAEDAPQLTADTRRTLTNAYSVSKALSEQLAWRLAARYSLELTAVRPCAIYGAFDPNFTAVFRRLVGFPLTVMPALVHLPLVYAGDVAGAIARALERPVSIGRAPTT